MPESTKMVKVTMSFYYEPDLTPGGGYWEPGGEYSRGVQHCRTVEEAAAFDKFNYDEGQFSAEEYLSFGADGDTEIKIEVVEVDAEGNQTVVYTVPEQLIEEPGAEADWN